MGPKPPFASLVAILVGLALAFSASPAVADADILLVDCDLVPDFVTTFTAIQDAVNASVTNGPLPDTIVVRPCTSLGTYDGVVTIPVEAWGLHILAADVAVEAGDTELLGAGTSGVGSVWPGPRPVVDGSSVPFAPCITVDAERVSIQGLELAHCGGGFGGWGILALANSKLLKVHDMLIRSLLGPGIEVVGADTPSLTSNLITQVSAHGIRLHGVTDAFVADNTFLGNSVPGAAGILISGGSEDVLVQRNEVKYAWGAGVHDRNSSRTRILRNTALDNCLGSTPGTCACNQILVDTSTSDTDVAGSDADGVWGDGISLCSVALPPFEHEKRENAP